MARLARQTDEWLSFAGSGAFFPLKDAQRVLERIRQIWIALWTFGHLSIKNVLTSPGLEPVRRP